ncbi:hypothetical protein ACWTU6_19820 [Mesorhizobium sp. BHbsci]
MPAKKRFSARNMFSELKQSGDFYLTGMVKEDENDPAVVLLSTNDDCTDWLPIHEDMIEEYERYGTAVCRDHSHVVVTLKLRRPASPEANIFARAIPVSGTIGRLAFRQAAGGSNTDCTWDAKSQSWVDRFGRPCIPRW